MALLCFILLELEKKEKDPGSINIGYQFIKEKERERGGGAVRKVLNLSYTLILRIYSLYTFYYLISFFIASNGFGFMII